MKVKINGKEEVLPQGVRTVEELVRARGLVPERIVVEVNLQVTSRENWAVSRLRDEDSIEIVSFVGGG